MTVQMGWNPDSPANALRVSLLAYLRARQHQLKVDANLAVVDELADLRRWIAWLDGRPVE